MNRITFLAMQAAEIGLALLKDIREGRSMTRESMDARAKDFETTYQAAVALARKERIP